MAQNITIQGASYSDVPSVTLPKTGGGTAWFTDVTPTTAVESDVTSGKVFFKADGTQSTGTATGGTSNWTLLASQEKTVSTTSTRISTVATISAGASAYTKDSVLWVHIRDKAGARAGYFFGSDVIFMNPWAANNESTLITTKSSQIFRYSADSKFESTTTTYGIYAYSLSSSGDIVIYSRYSSTSSLTINGTYLIEVYLLSMPSGDKLFN